MTLHKKKGVRAPTLADVGRAAGVSAMAASAALNETRTSARISEQTKVKILKAAERLGYRPNVAARALANRRMNTLGVSVVWEGDALNSYFVEIFNGIIVEAGRLGQSTTVFTFHNWGQEIESVWEKCDGRIDGMILIAPVFTAGSAVRLPRHIPFVALHANTEVEGMVNIESNEERGAYEMVSRLASLGHRRIMHVSGASGLVGADRRKAGYRRALADAGLTQEPDLLVESAYEISAGCRSMMGWLKAHSRNDLPDAIFCGNDAIAMGCLEALASEGIRVPDEVSLCGFDDTIGARTTVPQLSTVRQPLRAMGSRAVEVLVKRIDATHGGDPYKVVSPIVFDTTVVLRGSVAENPKTR